MKKFITKYKILFFSAMLFYIILSVYYTASTYFELEEKFVRSTQKEKKTKALDLHDAHEQIDNINQQYRDEYIRKHRFNPNISAFYRVSRGDNFSSLNRQFNRWKSYKKFGNYKVDDIRYIEMIIEKSYFYAKKIHDKRLIRMLYNSDKNELRNYRDIRLQAGVILAVPGYKKIKGQGRVQKLMENRIHEWDVGVRYDTTIRSFYIMKKGDNLWTLAKNYKPVDRTISQYSRMIQNTTLKYHKKNNNNKILDRIKNKTYYRPGDILVLPGIYIDIAYRIEYTTPEDGITFNSVIIKYYTKKPSHTEIYNIISKSQQYALNLKNSDLILRLVNNQENTILKKDDIIILK